MPRVSDDLAGLVPPCNSQNGPGGIEPFEIGEARLEPLVPAIGEVNVLMYDHQQVVDCRADSGVDRRGPHTIREMVSVVDHDQLVRGIADTGRCQQVVPQFIGAPSDDETDRARRPPGRLGDSGNLPHASQTGDFAGHCSNQVDRALVLRVVFREAIGIPQKFQGS